MNIKSWTAMLVDGKIKIDDDWVTVSPGYVQAETDYVGELSTEWYVNVYEGNIDEDLRQQILQKRQEFYQLYKDGKIQITPPNQQRSWWHKMWRRISGQPTQAYKRIS